MTTRTAHGLAWAQEQRERWALAKADDDAALFAMRRTMTLEQIGTRLGCSRQGVHNRLAAARARQRVREVLTEGNGA